MVHLDAHPDMSASAVVPADAIFEEPWKAYFAMRQDVGGIAQWILPAVYGGHLNEVWWVRPSWARQIADGDYPVSVGRHPRPPEATVRPTAERCAKRNGVTPAAAPVVSVASTPAVVPDTIHISCREPYFVEDGLFCPAEQLQAAKELRFIVSQLPAPEAPLPAPWASAPGRTTPWVLDVCLDYFACGNPFLNQVRPFVAEAVAAIQDATIFRAQSVADPTAFFQARDAFDAAYKEMMQCALRELDDAQNDDENNEDSGPAWEDAVSSLGPFLLEARREELLKALRLALHEARLSEIQQLSEAGDMACLPLHAVTHQEIVERLAAFETFLVRLVGSAESQRPALVTIARSVVDGFCPMRWHCALEQGVLEVLRRRFGDLETFYVDELDALENA